MIILAIIGYIVILCLIGIYNGGGSFLYMYVEPWPMFLLLAFTLRPLRTADCPCHSSLQIQSPYVAYLLCRGERDKNR